MVTGLLQFNISMTFILPFARAQLRVRLLSRGNVIMMTTLVQRVRARG